MCPQEMVRHYLKWCPRGGWSLYVMRCCDVYITAISRKCIGGRLQISTETNIFYMRHNIRNTKNRALYWFSKIILLNHSLVILLSGSLIAFFNVVLYVQCNSLCFCSVQWGKHHLYYSQQSAVSRPRPRPRPGGLAPHVLGEGGEDLE